MQCQNLRFLGGMILILPCMISGGVVVEEVRPEVERVGMLRCKRGFFSIDSSPLDSRLLYQIKKKKLN